MENAKNPICLKNPEEQAFRLIYQDFPPEKPQHVSSVFKKKKKRQK